MVAVPHPVTPTGFRVLTAMLRHREHGIDGIDRYALAVCAKADKSTVHTLLRSFIGVGWVTPSRSNDPVTGVPNATIYRLTDEAPSLDDLLGIEAA